MRALETHDVFKAMRVINSLGVKEEVKALALEIQNGEKELSQKEAGIEIILSIISHAGDEKAEGQIYDFLAGPLELATEDIMKMDPLELLENIKKLNEVVDVEKWKAFFNSVARLMK